MPARNAVRSAPALPATTEKATYMAGSSTVMDTFTGTGLWTLLQSAGGVKPIPGVKKNSSLLNYVVAVGSDGYQAVFSGGEINPMFGGSTKAVPVEPGTEPARQALTQPPVGYQVPSANYAYGEEKKGWLDGTSNPDKNPLAQQSSASSVVH